MCSTHMKCLLSQKVLTSVHSQDPPMLFLLIAIMLVLLSSALCSGAEAALFSVSNVKVLQLAKSGKKSGKALGAIRHNMSRPIAAIVVLNNIANIVGSIIVGGIATDILGSQWLGLFSGILTFLVIIFSEIIPKTLGERYAEKAALFFAIPVLYMTLFMTPVLWLIENITLPITGRHSPIFTTSKSEIKLMVKMGEKYGEIASKEATLIDRVFELNKTKADMIMTPRVALTYLDGNTPLNQVKQDIMTAPHSRILVVDGLVDQVMGVALKNELLLALLEGQATTLVSQFAHQGQFVSKSITAEKLLGIFQKSRSHLAVVVDEYGGISGVVTLEDVLEILTGEIVDETDIVVDLQAHARKNHQKTNKTSKA